MAFSGGYALIAMTQELADGYAADAESSSLADNETFQGDMEALGEQGVVSFVAQQRGVTADRRGGRDA